MHTYWVTGWLWILIGTSAFAQSFGAKFGDPEEYKDIPFAPQKMRGVLPVRVDLSRHFPQPGNQGTQSSCVGWAVGYSMKGYLEIKERGWSGRRSSEQFSPAYIYNQINDGIDEGAIISEALDLLMREGVATLSAFPYDERDYTRQPCVDTKESAREFAIASFRRLQMPDVVPQSRSHLAEGFPVVVGMLVGNALQEHRGGIYKAPDADTKVGGHAMCVVGYDDEKQAFKLINSWGTNWADGGYGWVSYDTYKAKVREAYVVQDVVVYRPEPDQPPTPPGVDDFEPFIADSPWIFADSATRRLRPTELRVRSAEQLWRARNEIYARRGYIFSTPRGMAYSTLLGTSYTPRTADASAIEAQFNEIEKYNIALIKSFEVSRPNPIGPQGKNPWVFADSSARRLNHTELARLNKESLWRARNEIFARNGFIFQSDKGRKFSASMGALYTPVSTDMNVIYAGFNSVETYNVNLIKRYEAALR